MYPIALNFPLPEPWQDKQFTTEKLGYINFLVGPNGSGKSRFCDILQRFIPQCRILNADRLSAFFSKPDGNNSHLIQSTSAINNGYSKGYFAHYKAGAAFIGSGADAFVILEEKLDIRIRVEATLTQLFNREIRLEWDAGNLLPMAYNISQKKSYNLAKDECHGIKELLVLLTHIYDDAYQSLIIDEPELNLHPQYQAFLLQEIRKIAGDPSRGKKIIFLVTHSPFILDIITPKDLSSVICFHSDFKEPSHLFDKTEDEIKEFSKIIPRLNVHHKQLFFADCPVFVEGIFDSQFIKAIQQFRGVSMEGSGSCIIDVGGNSEIAQYHKLIEAFNKNAKYIYDLDSIFTRALRSNADTDIRIAEFLAKVGAGSEFQKYCGELEQLLSVAIKTIESITEPDDEIVKLKEYLNKNNISTSDKDALKKSRVAILIHLGAKKQSLNKELTSIKVQAIEGKLNAIINALKEQGVYLLKDGALEHYLPSYEGDIYEVSDSIKKKTVEREIEYLFSSVQIDELGSRYGYLFDVIQSLPAGKKVDYLSPIKGHLGGLIYKIQNGIQSEIIKSIVDVPNYIGNDWASFNRILTINELTIISKDRFTCECTLLDKWGIGEMGLIINENTNSGMGQFELVKA